MMPGGSAEAYKAIQPIVEKVAAQVDDGPCVMYIGEGGAGNYVKMVHNGIEYGDMQVRGGACVMLSWKWWGGGSLAGEGPWQARGSGVPTRRDLSRGEGEGTWAESLSNPSSSSPNPYCVPSAHL